MIRTDNDTSIKLNKPLGLSILLLALLVILIIFLLIWGSRLPNRPLKPAVPTPTAGASQIAYDPVSLTFFDLENDPAQYRNQRIRVSGRFSRIALPDCQPYSGPIIRWGLINDTLQMNAVGYEAIVRTLPDNVEMTVEGIWKFYSGGVGCGKEPSQQKGIWYLKVEHILQPNPILASNSLLTAQLTVVAGDSSGVSGVPIETTATAESAAEATATNTSTPAATLAVTGTSTVPATATVTATAPLNSSSTPTATATLLVTVPQNGSSTPTATNSPTAVPTISPPATPTPGSAPPPASTATPGSGYPPPPPGGGYP